MSLFRRHYLKSGLLVVLLVAAGLVAWKYHPADNAAAKPAAPLVPVVVAQAAALDVPLILNGLGNVQASQQALVRAQVDGQLIEVGFHEGSEVKAGDVLARIDPRTYQAQVNQAAAKLAQDQASLANAKVDLQRYQDLVQRQFVSQQQLDNTKALAQQLEAQVQGDRAALDSAKVLLGYTIIKSPLNGRAGIRLVDVGNVVRAADASGLVMVTQLHPIAVLFTLAEDQVGKVLAAQAKGPLTVTVYSRDGQQVLDRGKLELMDSQIDQTTAMVKLKALCPNNTGLLWPGQFVNAQLEVGVAQGAVTIPTAAVQRGQQGSFVWVVDAENKARVRPVTLGQINGTQAVVEKGVDVGETVVVNGHYRLQPGVGVVAK